MEQAKNFRKVKLTEVMNEVNKARANNKYTLIFDTTDNVEVFFRYKGTLKEVYKMSIGITMGQPKEESIEHIRKGLVYCMKSGDTLVLHSSKIVPDYKEKFNDAKLLPSEKIFDFAEWRKEANYKSILIDDEDQDNFGNKGFFTMNDDFTIVMLSTT